MVISQKIVENKMGNRGSKSDFITFAFALFLFLFAFASGRRPRGMRIKIRTTAKSKG